MLERLRAAQSTWLGKAVLAVIFVLIIVGLSFFGFADLFRSRGGTWALNVGGVEVSGETYRQAYQNGFEQLQQRLRRPVTNAQAREMGLDRQVLSTLVRDALLDGQVDKLGLAISDPQIGRIIAQDPSFADSNGRFDQAKFTAFLQNVRTTEQTFVRDQRGSYLRQEILDALGGTVAAPKAAVEALHRLQAETRSVDAVVLEPSLVGTLPTPDDATLQAFFDAHKAQFAAPEYRKLTLLAVTPAAVAKPDAVSPADIQQAYENAPASRFGSPERRTLQQIVFPNQTEAEAAALRLAAGTTFEALAAERKVEGKDLDLGTVTKSQIFDKAVADAAFALPAGGTSPPVAGAFGPVILHVIAVQPGDKKPLDAVAATLRQEVAEEPSRTRSALRDLHDRVEDQRASGKPLAEAAKSVGFDVRTVDAVDATGHDKSGALVDMADRDAVLRAAFASDVGVDNDVVQTRSGDQVWFEVAGVEPAKQRSFAEVRPAAEAGWRKEQTTVALGAKADAMVATLTGGAGIEQVAAEAGNAPVKHAADVKRAGSDGFAPTVVAKIFDTPVGSAGTADPGDGTRVVFKVLDSAVPPLDLEVAQTKQLEAQYRAWLSEDLLAGYLNRLQDSVGVKVNPDVLRAAGGEAG